MRFGGAGKVSADSSASAMAFELGFSTRNRCTKECCAFFSTSSRNACFCPRCGFRISTRCPAFSVRRLFEQFAILEIQGHVDVARQIGGVEIELLQQRRQKFRRIEILQIFPIEIAAVDHAAAAQVKQIHGNLRRLGVPGQHVRIVALRRGDLLPLLHLLERAQQIAIAGGLFVALLFGSCCMRCFRLRARSLRRPSRKSRTSRAASRVPLVRPPSPTQGPRQR